MTTNNITFVNALKYSLLAGLIAAFINTVLFLLFQNIGWISSEILLPGKNEPITLAAVIMSSIVPTLICAVLLVILNKFSKNPVRAFVMVALTVMIVTFLNPFLAIPNAPLKMSIALDILHLPIPLLLIYFYHKQFSKNQ